MYGALHGRDHRTDKGSSPSDAVDPSGSMDRLDRLASNESVRLGPDDPGAGDDDETDPVQATFANGQRTGTWFLITLTIAAAGLQIVWSVEFSSVSPFLLSLGLSKALMALVWIAGPLSGSLVQPYVGIKSDDCRIPWGRRRPFMIGGAIATCISLMLLSWTREIVGGITWVFGAGPESSFTIVSQQIFAVVLVYVLDFAVNVIQAGMRAFIVDCAPTHLQEDANAWASRIAGAGNIVGYLAGYVDLPSILPFLGRTQFQVLCALAVVIILSTLTLSCSLVSERDPRTFGEPSNAGASLWTFFSSLYRSVRRLPLQIKRVCQVQLFAWIGWFPFLFYITSYIGQIYANPYFEENPNMTKEEIEAVFAKGTRMGAFAMLVFACTTFVTSVFLPFLIIPAYAAPEELKRSNHAGSFNSHISQVLARIRIPGLTLRRTWMLSHVVFCCLTWTTLLVRGTTLAVIIVGLIGIPWAITNWAPFALIAAEISARDAQRRRHSRSSASARRRSSDAGDISSAASAGSLRRTSSSFSHHEATLPTVTSASADLDGAVDQAGIVLGIHNVSIAAPQVLATLASSVIFQILQKPRGQPGDDSIGWVLRLGGIAALGAAVWCRRVADGPLAQSGYERVRDDDTGTEA